MSSISQLRARRLARALATGQQGLQGKQGRGVIVYQ